MTPNDRIRNPGNPALQKGKAGVGRKSPAFSQQVYNAPPSPHDVNARRTAAKMENAFSVAGELKKI